MELPRKYTSSIKQLGLLSLMISMSPCLADTVSTPPAGISEAVNSTEQSQMQQNSSTEKPSSSADPVAVAPPPAGSASSEEPVSGPLLEKRKLVLSRIMAAKKQGTGISGYLAEFNRIEQMVKAGEPETAYAGRLSSLQTGIDDQIKRSQILKTQHPTAMSGSSTSSSSSSSGSSTSAGGASSGGSSVGGLSIEQLKAKYGDKVPAGIADKLGAMSPEQKEKLLNSDALRKLLGK